ncbi:MAG: hypothetical protein ACFFCI_13365 [Promethearchaeota archaeon]
MKLRKKLIKLGFAFFFILLSSYIIAEWTVDYKYLKYSDNKRFYLNSEQTEYTEERSAEKISKLERGTSIELRIRQGSLFDITTEPVSGDLDIDIILVVSFNYSSELVLAYSITIGSSREHISVESRIRSSSIYELIFSDYPRVELLIIPVTGSGIISLHYETLHPVEELVYLCVVSLIIGASFFIKNVFDLIKFKKIK